MRFAVRERRAFCTGFGDAGQRPFAKVRKGEEVDRVKPVFFDVERHPPAVGTFRCLPMQARRQSCGSGSLRNLMASLTLTLDRVMVVRLNF